MINEKYKFNFISPAFITGADQKQAELRTSSIRGELRWWFRVLGGFKSLQTRFPNLAEQERYVFGGMVAGGAATASSLQVRVQHNLIATQKDAQDLNAGMNTPQGYLLFPMRRQNRSNPDISRRGVFMPDKERFFEVSLSLIRNKELQNDIKALMTVFGHWGSLGTRSRRGLGAIAFAQHYPDLFEALASFVTPDAVVPKVLPKTESGSNTLDVLGEWLRGWRSHGRTPDLTRGPGFQYAKNDHDLGVDIIRQRHTSRTAYRPALGLPIIQRYSDRRGSISWDARSGRDKGRFASPVLLRPYLSKDNQWLPLVLFINSRTWIETTPVHVGDQRVRVSLDLYNAMQRDPALQPFTER